MPVQQRYTKKGKLETRLKYVMEENKRVDKTDKTKQKQKNVQN